MGRSGGNEAPAIIFMTLKTGKILADSTSLMSFAIICLFDCSFQLLTTNSRPGIRFCIKNVKININRMGFRCIEICDWAYKRKFKQRLK